MCLDQDLPTNLSSTILAGLRVVHLSVVEQLQLRQQGRSFAGFQRENECFRRALQRELDCVPKLQAEASAEVTATLQRGQHASTAAIRRAAPGCALHSRVYDFFLFVRPDLFWLQAFPFEALFERNAVSLRAQRLCFDPSKLWFSEQAQSAYHLRCSACHGCSMRPDDQFALVPRRFAAAYFAEHQFFEDNASTRTLVEREREYTVLLSHTASSSTSLGLDVQCKAPPKPNVAGHLSYSALCGIGGGVKVDRNTLQKASGAFGAEGLKAFRLSLRRVPLVLRGFPVHLTGSRVEKSTGATIVTPRWWYQGRNPWPNASRSCMN